MSTSTLESRNYVAGKADATALASQMFDGQSATDTVPRMYLRAVVATTIHELEEPLRQRTGRVAKIDETEQARQSNALEKVIELLYPPVVAHYREKLGKVTAEELNSRTGWARGAHRDVRNWIRAGQDLRTLAPAKLIKANLAVKTGAKRAPSAARAKQRVETRSKDLVASLLELASIDKDAAVAEMTLLVGQLAAQMEELGVKYTKDAKQAAAEHRPFRVGKSVFFPTETQLLRQAERPS
jgi:hypothetical protein